MLRLTLAVYASTNIITYLSKRFAGSNRRDIDTNYVAVHDFMQLVCGRYVSSYAKKEEFYDALVFHTYSYMLTNFCPSFQNMKGVSVVVIIIPWLILAIFPITVAYYYLLLHYRKSGSDLQRLDAVSRSPLQAMVSEALDGSSTIRVFHQQDTFFARFHTAVDINSSALLNFVSAQR